MGYPMSIESDSLRRQAERTAALMGHLRRRLRATKSETERATLGKQLDDARALVRLCAEADALVTSRELYDLQIPVTAWQPAKTVAGGAIETKREIPFHHNWRSR
jgi:hypothetical protein